MKKIKKYLFVVTFIGFILGGILFSVLKSDSKFSEIENKILTQKPEMNFLSIKTGSYMRQFDKYVVDQFPYRIELIKMKNQVSRLLGNKEFKGVYVTKNSRMLEKYILNKDMLRENLETMNDIKEYFSNIKTTGMFIPNSILIYNNEIPWYFETDSQLDTLSYIEKHFKGEFYTPYLELKKNKDKYIYFYTDHHWTQLGAKIMYEDYYRTKVNYEYEKVSDDFLGTYYSKVLINEKRDSIYSYKDLSGYEMIYDEKKSDSLYNMEYLKGKNKYRYFLNGDPGMALIEGEGEGNVLIFKDSFAHCYIPFLTKEYSKIHVVDPRYSNVDIIDYIDKNKDIEEIFYVYSLTTLNSSNIFAKYKNKLNFK